MRNWIKKELGCQAQVVCSQTNFGGLGGVARETLSDYSDMHAYWEHPTFGNGGWDPVNWKIGNTAMTRSPSGGAFPALARYRLTGKPFTVSEYNHPAPNDFRAESMPMLAAYAAAQDWDGLYLFDYHADREGWSDNRIRGFFSVDSDPARMALFPAAAMLFLRGDIAPLEDETRVELGEGDLVGQIQRQGSDVNACWDRAGGMWPLALDNRVSIALVPNSAARVAVKKLPGKKGDKREPALHWPRSADPNKAMFTANSARSKVVVGFLGERGADLPGWKVEQTSGDADRRRNAGIRRPGAVRDGRQAHGRVAFAAADRGGTSGKPGHGVERQPHLGRQSLGIRADTGGGRERHDDRGHPGSFGHRACPGCDGETARDARCTDREWQTDLRHWARASDAVVRDRDRCLGQVTG